MPIPIGTLVRIRTAEQIASTLDEHACCDGLPFLPEMTKYCGRELRLVQHANNVCTNAGEFQIRALNGAVVLQTERCTGEHIGGCQMACRLLWNLAWIDVGDKAAESPLSRQALQRLDLYQIASAAVARTPGRFHCQATALSQCATPVRSTNLRQYIREVRSGGLGVRAVGYYLVNRIARGGLIRGIADRTPAERIGLRVGQWAEVKSLDEIRQTLDSQGCNRGLWFDPVMAQHCGKRFEVTAVVTQIIDEQTGHLLTLRQPSIVLDELACNGLLRRFCSRQMLNFWREIWLRRVEPK